MPSELPPRRFDDVAIGQFCMPPYTAAIPPPSWDVFQPCGSCHAATGEPCIDRRQWLAGEVRSKCKPLNNPHKGRRQIGPKAGRSIYLRGLR